MKDERSLRQELDEYRALLTQAEEAVDVYSALVKGTEGLLRMKTANPNGGAALAAALPKEALARSSTPVGAMSLRSAVLKALRDARGEPLTSKELWIRVQEMGAGTKSKDPEAMMDLVAYNLKSRGGAPIEKIRPRTWR